MQPFPRWVSWVFVGLLAYIIYLGNQSQRPPESAPQDPPTITQNEGSPREYDALRRLTDGDRWFRAINPNHVGDANIKEISVGEGMQAACGHEVEIRLRGTDTNGASFDEAHDESKPLRFIVGDAPIDALNEGVIGMRQGGARQLIAPARFVYKDPKKHARDEIKFHLTLDKQYETATGDMPAIAVTTITGSEKVAPARCGAPIKADISIFNAEGTRLYRSDEPLRFTLGKRELALGIDVLARDMRVGEERLFTIPPYYLVRSAKSDATLSAARNALTAKQVRIVQIARTE